MTRDIAKVLEEYRNRFYKPGCRAGGFYASDIFQIIEVSEKMGRYDTIEKICNALEAGFMVGYKYAKREQRKVNRRKDKV